MRIRWSLSLIFLDFKCVTMWIWRGWFRWDVHHAVSRDFWRWWQLRHSLPRQTYPACLLRVYHHLTDIVGSSPLLRFPLHWRTRNGQCVSYLYYRPFLQGAARRSHYFSCAKSVQSQCKVRAMAKRVLTLPSRSLTWRRKVGMKRLCGKGAFLLSQKIFSKRCSFLCTFSKPVKVGCSKFRKISAGF